MNATRAKQTFSVEKAYNTQLKLAGKIVFKDKLPKKVRLIAGVDIAYSEDKSIGAVAVLDYGSLELIETQTTISKTLFPYIPTLLSFREIPPAVSSIRKLRSSPDVFLADGQGYAHPYHCGFASHLGLVTNKPTIGVAKSRLYGEVEKAQNEDLLFLKHNDEIIGAAIKTKRESKPIYVSVGHMVSLEKAIEIVRHCTRNSRIPKPILEAHRIATEEKQRFNNS
jgi:deoxyribonuclease V